MEYPLLQNPAFIRNFGLLIPLLLTFLLWWWRKPNTHEATGILLACLWNFPAGLLLQCLARHYHWWHYQAEGGLILAMPVDLLFAWALLWGAIPRLILPKLNLLLLMALLLWLDLLLMPRFYPVVQLNDHWLTGEVVALLLCLLPAQLLARWTATDRHLVARTTLQVILFSSLSLLVLPTIMFEQTSESWQPLFTRTKWLNGIYLQLLAIPAAIGISAVQEFAQRGKGTPLPYDPPRRLVTSGIYAYIANPMQSSMCLLLLGWSLVLQSYWMLGATLMTFIYSLGLAAWDEKLDLQARYGERWQNYRQAVKYWWPGWRPWHPSLQPENGEEISPAKLYFNAECPLCCQLAQWLKLRQPLAMVLVAAQEHPTRDLRRLTYEDDGVEAEGIVALARALEHINLAWALLGCFMRLPLLSQLIQLFSDALGGEPRQVYRRRQD